MSKLLKKGVMLLIISLVICLIKPIPVNAASSIYLSKKHGSLDTFEKATYTFNVPYKSEIDINFIGFGSKPYEMTFGSFYLTIKNAKGKDVFLSQEDAFYENFTVSTILSKGTYKIILEENSHFKLDYCFSIKGNRCIELKKNTSYSLKKSIKNISGYKRAKYTSSNKAVATVSSSGKIKAKTDGMAKITAKIGSKKIVFMVYVDNGFVDTSYCYKKINKYRKNVGAEKLKRDVTLEKYAKIRAKELVRQYSHYRPNDQLGPNMVSATHSGENIAKDQDTCLEVMTSWYRSPGHRKNMLDKDFKKVGIAGYKYNGRIYWVQLFSS